MASVVPQVLPGHLRVQGVDRFPASWGSTPMTTRLQIPNPLYPKDTLVLVDFLGTLHSVSAAVQSDCIRPLTVFAAHHLAVRDLNHNPPLYLNGKWQHDPEGPGPPPCGIRLPTTKEMELWAAGKGHVVIGRHRRGPGERWNYFIATEAMGIRWDGNWYRVDDSIVPGPQPSAFSRGPNELQLKPWWVNDAGNLIKPESNSGT